MIAYSGGRTSLELVSRGVIPLRLPARCIPDRDNHQPQAVQHKENRRRDQVTADRNALKNAPHYYPDDRQIDQDEDGEYPAARHDGSKSHDVVAAVNVQRLAGNARSEIGSQEQRRVPDFFWLYIPFEWGMFGMAFQ